ncbi:fungal-specific transcription factor [Aspergillus indologenus CBS 114.80]|uniref:Fungal-specific transcription factor n=1 Tax=Aspergillus indologenus CBS 114.80 TaxID=1450541 RepID=A0A2V5J5G5_9EURO|nr:fungal-specific transcription factor [Aspergillus indologenus CBS 114.80]
MELVWLADIPQGRRRSRALRACAHCQRKKKRCRHLATEDVVNLQSNQRCEGTVPEVPQREQQPQENVAQSLLDTNSSTTVTTARTTSTTPIIHKSSRTERFVGDLNPEAAIREELDFANGIQLRDRIGLWVSSPTVQTCEEHISHSESTRAHDAPSHHGLGSRSVASLLHQQSEFAFKACERLPNSTRNHLLPIYFTKLNHILPLVDPDSLLSPHAGDLISVLLERAVCLVAAKDRAAEPYLRLCEEGQVMTSRQFCSEIYGELVVAMNVGLEADRITRIRILALMSLHCEGYEGAELASMHLCQAIHQAQTVGLHLHRPGRRSEVSLSSLFWCLWTLDRMHACLGGRPVLMSERDIGIAKPRVDHIATKSAFDIWFAISDLLSMVISFYRPASDHTVGWEADFPTFESITGDRCSDLDFATLDFLELYYHAVCILSCRYRLSHPADLSKPSYVRQGLAAVRIHSIVATECSGGLPPLPIIPYALTLSMGVSYQQFRSSKLITHLDRARAGLEACCVLLERISAYWSTAEAMARLGRKALHQIDVLNPKYQLHDHENEQSLDLPSVCTPRSSEETMPVLLPSSSNAGQGIHTDILLPISSDHECGQFADIDFLFGEFLDLSLPTNFLNPVFLSPEQPEA